METQIETTEAPKVPKPVRRRRKRRAKPREPRQPKAAKTEESIFKGLGEGKTRCADACTKERCVITHKDRCGWPSLQAEDSREAMTVIRHKEARLYHAHQVAEKKGKR